MLLTDFDTSKEPSLLICSLLPALLFAFRPSVRQSTLRLELRVDACKLIVLWVTSPEQGHTADGTGLAVVTLAHKDENPCPSPTLIR